MSSRLLSSCALLIITAAAPARAQLTVVLEAPTAPANATVTIAGDFNRWNPAAPGYALQRQPNGNHRLTLPDSVRGSIEFKFTLGSWQTVETDAAGADVANRVFMVPSAGAVTYSATVASWRDPASIKPRAHTARATVSIIDTAFVMPQLQRTRRVWIYLPPDYAQSARTYPVLYMHDGQNLFDDATSFSGEWGVDETLDSLFARGDSGVIVVGIDNGGTRRLDEYSPWKNARYGGGEGEAYVEFLVRTLKPYIDTHYRTRADAANTAIAGSSMGGLISLYAALAHPNVFGRAGVFSPALWFAPALFDFARAAAVANPPRLYFVSGALESQQREEANVYARQQQRMVDQLAAQDFVVGKDVVAYIRADGTHAEWFWRREFPLVYQWLFRR